MLIDSRRRGFSPIARWMPRPERHPWSIVLIWFPGPSRGPGLIWRSHWKGLMSSLSSLRESPADQLKSVWA